jgi:hypothetical protein
MEKQTRTVDIGGGWQAEICRPPSWVTSLWGRALRKGGATPVVTVVEHGRDPEPEKPAETEKFELLPEHLEIWERDVYPHVVIAFVNPEGARIERAALWLADLGLTRFHNLMRECSDMVLEADRSFRDAIGAPE